MGEDTKPTPDATGIPSKADRDRARLAADNEAKGGPEGDDRAATETAAHRQDGDAQDGGTGSGDA